jgi:hypothetical protein
MNITEENYNIYREAFTNLGAVKVVLAETFNECVVRPVLSITEADVEAEVSRLEAVGLQEVANKEARDYLASTDWYITRQSETGVVVPTDVLTKREAARVSVINNA